MAKKNKHHYIPASYLAGFTKGGNRKSSFWAVPRDNSKPYGTNPNDSCAERNYYTVNSLHDDPLKVEDWYGDKIETEIGKVLKHIADNESLPCTDNMEFLITFVAILYLRNPSFREVLSIPIKREYEIIISMLTSSKSLYERHIDKAIDDGYIKERMPYHRFKSSVQNGSFQVSVNKDFLIETELKMLLSVAKMLASRKWTLFVVGKDEDYELITSDNPFILYHPRNNNYGLESTDSEVFVPINNRMLLVGVFDSAEDSTRKASRKIIGFANKLIVENCRKTFYTKEKSVTFSDGFEVWQHSIGI